MRICALLALAGAACSAAEAGAGPAVVASVSVVSPASSVQVDATIQLAASAKDASGATLGGKSFTWSSSDASRAAVNSAGLVTGKMAGAVSISAVEAGSGQSGSMTLTITPLPAPVATVRLAPDTITILQASNSQLSLVLEDSVGNPLTGRTVTWNSSDTVVVTVSPTGSITGVAAGGPVTITAASEGKSGTATVTVNPRTATHVAVTPAFVVLGTETDTTLHVDAFDSAGVAIPVPVVAWTSADTLVATVGVSGAVHGTAAGLARIAATVNDAADTATVAVLGAGSLLSTAFAGGQIQADVKPGQSFTVPVTLDLSKVSASGDLGSAQFELSYDPDVLTFSSAQAAAGGTSDHNVPEPGTFKYSLARTDSLGAPTATLITLTFEVAVNATVGSIRAFTLTYTASPSSTDFQSYSIPITVGGRVRIINP